MNIETQLNNSHCSLTPDVQETVQEHPVLVSHPQAICTRTIERNFSDHRFLVSSCHYY